MELLKRINIKLAANTMIILNLCIVILHISIIVGIIPYAVIWDGHLENESQMYFYEIASLSINLLVITAIGIRVGYIKPYLSKKIVDIVLWALVILFSLNSVGNIVSINSLESTIFTAMTIIVAIFCFRLIIER